MLRYLKQFSINFCAQYLTAFIIHYSICIFYFYYRFIYDAISGLLFVIFRTRVIFKLHIYTFPLTGNFFLYFVTKTSGHFLYFSIDKFFKWDNKQVRKQTTIKFGIYPLASGNRKIWRYSGIKWSNRKWTFLIRHISLVCLLFWQSKLRLFRFHPLRLLIFVIN